MSRRNVQLKFNPVPLNLLDDLALKIQRPKYVGNDGDWFLTFRESLEGFHARLYGVTEHYWAVHTWLPKRRIPLDHEYQISSLFFHLDSSLECFVFMLNAFGYGCARAEFKDITDEKALRSIGIKDLIGGPTNSGFEAPRVSGYQKVFPRIQKQWIAKQALIFAIVDQHDVSKHRKAIFRGGRCETDPPDGFLDSVGLSRDSAELSAFWPMQDILLQKDPKLPLTKRLASDPNINESMVLEYLIDDYVQMINNSCAVAHEDALAFLRQYNTL